MLVMAVMAQHHQLLVHQLLEQVVVVVEVLQMVAQVALAVVVKGVLVVMKAVVMEL
jgi:hypothetical protein